MTLVLLAAAATLCSWGATWLLWRRPGFIPLDRPNERSLHLRPTPRTGGIGIAVGFTVAVVGLWACSGRMTGIPPLAATELWIVLAMAPLFVTSLWNDRRELPPLVRLSIQVVIAAAFLVATDLTIASIALPGLGTWRLGLAALPITLLFLVWMMNLYNFMDGMDGFAGGMTVFGFAFLATTMRGLPSLAWLATLVATAALGFLLHNFPPARIFMGDTGSVPLGFAAGAISLAGVRGGAIDLCQGILVFSPFVVDATATLCVRLWRGERVWKAHRQHAYQRLVLSGWSHRRTVLFEYVLMFLAGTSATLYGSLEATQRVLLLILWAVAYVLLGGLVSRITRSSA